MNFSKGIVRRKLVLGSIKSLLKGLGCEDHHVNCSIEVGIAHNPRPFIPLIAPTPLLLTVAVDDTITLTDLQLAAFSEAREPKQLQLLPGGHFIVYDGPLFERNVSTQTEFLKKWIL